jgi:hypothetical protein
MDVLSYHMYTVQATTESWFVVCVGFIEALLLDLPPAVTSQ